MPCFLRARKGEYMIQTNAFNYINILEKAADASWLRNEAIANNLANVDTPYYKRQDVSFEAELQKALGDSRYISMDEKVKRVDLSQINPRPFTDYAGYSYRLDKNNVDVDQENVYLAENQLKYQGLMAGLKVEFQNLQAAMK